MVIIGESELKISLSIKYFIIFAHRKEMVSQLLNFLFCILNLFLSPLSKSKRHFKN